MSDPTQNHASAHHQPSRLQRRAPSSLQINRAVDWNVAIPLLSPLTSSPTTQQPDHPKPQDPPQRHHDSPAEKKTAAAAFMKWQHPAAPFFYEPAPGVPSFVPV
ncbi:uncharacterized protein At4g14450, chloroplastic-like [Arachis stenosperma]|uniref:uncharacterized protein At4g14450, chloroplastic-like n=1 Tax=Arachis stenosperma TaxID=217475 RepID=UPI0025ABD4D8|nr:uncharacterized protein At4g14450, chloroplastic-like [Arachis stenosperma]